MFPLSFPSTIIFSALFFLLPTDPLLRPWVQHHLWHPLQCLQVPSTTRTPSSHSLFLEGVNTSKQSTWGYGEREMEKRIGTALEGKRQRPLEMAQFLQYNLKVAWMTPPSDDLDHSVPLPPLHFNKTPTNKTKPNRKTIQPTPRPPQIHSLFLQEEMSTCKLSSYPCAGSQLDFQPRVQIFWGWRDICLWILP